MESESRKTDAIIVGGGPAGVSCAVWLKRLGVSVRLLEAQDALGGLCRNNPFPDDWNVALPGATGENLAHQLERSVADAGVDVRLSWPVAEVRSLGSGGFVVTREGLDDTVHGACLVLATGVRARPLPELEGRKPQAGSGILVGPGRHVASTDFSGKHVAVLGGGDNAFENARYALDRGAATVHVHARTVRAGHHVKGPAWDGDISVGPYRVDPRARTVNGRRYDLILVFYGWEPVIPHVAGLARTPDGHVAIDPATTGTSCTGIYAIGEVAQRQHPCVVTAMADGIVAAKAIQARIEAARA